MYQAPIADIFHCLKHVAQLDDILGKEPFADLSEDLVLAILEEAARFANSRIAPLRRIGDQQGARYDNSHLDKAHVIMPEGWQQLYRDWCAAGWNGVSAPVDYGGQGLPMVLAIALSEMWNSGSIAFALCPTLTGGAIEALHQHGTQDLKDLYLPKLVSGEWNGTMNLTEPHAGSDLGSLRTRAERQQDGRYRLFGQKIFITYGENSLSENVVHFVLARLPDAPEGSRGISLFLVPKFLPDENGNPAIRNDVFCASIEEKAGIHASPTCTMIFGDGFAGEQPGAIGYLIGEENRGLNCMFTMMNNARLQIGVEGYAVAEAAYQLALNYAQERKQGYAVGAGREDGMSAIIAHPDVQNMLLTMKAMTQAARAISYNCAASIDRAQMSEDAQRQFWANRAALLTPIAKAFPTDIGVEVTSLGIQVHGGMGYIEETGAAQLWRDARIAPIYEGTNGIQAIDLVQRKLGLEEGRHIATYIEELVQEVGKRADFAGKCDAAFSDWRAATVYLQTALGQGRINDALAGATSYLRLFALIAGAAYLVKGADTPERQALCHYFIDKHLPETSALHRRILNGAGNYNLALT